MQADEIASNEYPVLPLYYKSNSYLLKDYVQGVYMTSSSNIYFKNASGSCTLTGGTMRCTIMTGGIRGYGL